ncbi:hypothetical protein TNCV_5092081 [Trichonephila clavipes]|nr:hypothetical protein TNCV_5092081 [Trichonephila clavipes]
MSQSQELLNNLEWNGQTVLKPTVEVKARLRAYVGWLNSQLRKEEGGVRRVSDLRNDLRDGVILSHLVASLEICDGDLKAIMRLVHAVASHYKPDTVLNPPRPMQRYANGSQTKMCRVEVLQA